MAREWVIADVPVCDADGVPIMRDGEPVMEQARVIRWEAFARWRSRATMAFVAVAVAATAAAYLGWAAQRSSSAGFARSARSTVLQSCLDRADGKITTALGFDQLRFDALTQPPRTAQQRRLIEQFLVSTQRPINALLNQAAFGTIRPQLPIETVGQLIDVHTGREDPELRRARREAVARCRRQAAAFNGPVT